MCNVHQREIARYMARDRSELKRRISTIRADVRFLIRYRVAPEKLISLLSLLLEINLEYILNFILFELIISVIYLNYSLTFDSWFEYTGWLVKNWSHYYTLLSRIYSQLYFIRINYICLLLLFTWTILLRSILDSNIQNGSWKIDLIITSFYLEYSQLYFIRINYICLLLLLFTWTFLFYSILDSNVQDSSWKIDLIITRFYLEYILNFILFELIISLYCCYLLELFSYVRFLIRIYRVAREKLISLLHAFISNIFSILFELIIFVYCCYLFELFFYIRFEWLVKNWSHYYTLLSRIYSQFYFIRINYLFIIVVTWTILLRSIWI